jgi:hypothetical protein
MRQDTTWLGLAKDYQKERERERERERETERESARNKTKPCMQGRASTHVQSNKTNQTLGLVNSAQLLLESD